MKIIINMHRSLHNYEHDSNDIVYHYAEYSNHRHGWFNISSARIEEVKNGYIIRMPKALLLD